MRVPVRYQMSAERLNGQETVFQPLTVFSCSVLKTQGRGGTSIFYGRAAIAQIVAEYPPAAEELLHAAPPFPTINLQF